MVDTPPRRTRHYDKVEELVIRTSRDVSPAFVEGRGLVEPIVEELRGPRPTRPSLVPSADGAIERLLLTIPAYAVGSPVLRHAYRRLLAQLGSAVDVVALTHESVEGEVTAWVAECGPDTAVVAAPDHLNFSVWAEDGYVVITDPDGDGAYLLEPFSFPRYGDSLVADFVANATDLRTTQAPLYFQGGNVLVGDDFFLLGADYPARSRAYVADGIVTPAPGESLAALVRRLYSEYLDPQRELVYVGATIPVPEQTERTVRLDGEEWTEMLYTGNEPGTAQPLFHIDMFITLAGRGDDGRYRLLVGDPRAAADILDQPLQPHAMAEVFDNVARILEQRGFDVRRNPLPLVYLDDEEARVRVWYFATSNNALVATVPQPTVYLPTYGHGAWPELTATDEANRAVWEEVGFAAVDLGDFHPFAENLGAVHCITKYLRRSPPAQPGL